MTRQLNRRVLREIEESNQAREVRDAWIAWHDCITPLTELRKTMPSTFDDLPLAREDLLRLIKVSNDLGNAALKLERACSELIEECLD